MNAFAELLFESLKHSLKQINDEIPNDIENYCIASGSNFTIHKNISYEMAKKIYKKMIKNLDVTTRASHEQIGKYLHETYYAMESNSGIVHTLMFPITNIIEHNPNDVIKEWEKNKK